MTPFIPRGSNLGVATLTGVQGRSARLRSARLFYPSRTPARHRHSCLDQSLSSRGQLPLRARSDNHVISSTQRRGAPDREGALVGSGRSGGPGTRRSDVVRDIVERYPVAGVILDDYFYPYPSRSYSERLLSRTATSYAKIWWQCGLRRLASRRILTSLISRFTLTLSKAARPDILFGVGPFGIYQKGLSCLRLP